MASAQKENLKELKEQLNQIQSEINRAEKDEQGQEVKDLLSWRAPARSFRKRDNKWFINVAILVLALIVILLFIKEFIAISVVLAVAFVFYVMATVPPEEIEHKITTQGITSAGHTYLWGELTDFWFTRANEQMILNVGTTLRYPGRLMMLLGGLTLEKIKEILAPHIPFREIPKTSWLDRLATYLHKKLPASMR